MTNTSETGGYLKPSSTELIPGNLTLSQFIQSVIVGVSGLPGDMVRPKWQTQPPVQPNLETNWVAYGISRMSPDTFAYVAMDADDNTEFQRQEEIEVQCSFYGPLAFEYAGYLRDGLQLQQNTEALKTANMVFVSTGEVTQIPDLVNARWIQRLEQTMSLRRQIQRYYPVLDFASATGQIKTVLEDAYSLDWQVEEPA